MSISKKYCPFIGLTFGGIHSSDLGLYRVSDGSRYNEDLLPSFSDKTQERPAEDGMYFFGAPAQSKTWTIDFAFDNVTEDQLHQIKQLFGNGAKEPKKLVFDEDRDYEAESVEIDNEIEVYTTKDLNSGENETVTETEPPIKKYYLAKVAQPPQIKSLCFDEERDGVYIDIYKGELTVEFISYAPYGYGLENLLVFDNFEGGIEEKRADLNLGDLNSYPMLLFYRNTSSNEDITITTLAVAADQINEQLILNNLIIPKEKYGIVIDFEKGLINGLDAVPTLPASESSIEGISYVKDTVIYNQFIVGGNFFKIPNKPLNSETTQMAYTITIPDSLNDFEVVLALREKMY